jgi:hypothetical protein
MILDDLRADGISERQYSRSFPAGIRSRACQQVTVSILARIVRSADPAWQAVPVAGHLGARHIVATTLAVGRSE